MMDTDKFVAILNNIFFFLPLTHDCTIFAKKSILDGPAGCPLLVNHQFGV